MANSKCLALFCDEVTTIDNQSQISIHFYVVQDWCRIPILIFLEQVIERGGVDYLTKDIMDALKKHGGLFYVVIVAKLISFGFDGVNVFQGVRNGVTHQMQYMYSPHLGGIHCMVHCTNLVMQTLFQIPIMKSIKDLLQSLYFSSFTSQKGILNF